jgi:hypothetical protein
MSEFRRLQRRPVRLDTIIRDRLKTWPQRPPGAASLGAEGAWLRARPSDGEPVAQPYLKIPGSDRMRTIPDGLWLHFSPDPDDRWADILCIEACSTFQNLLDKRSRFAPSTISLLAHCPLPWLLAPLQANDSTPRWLIIPFLTQEPVAALTVPVRDLRVLYGLQREHYQGFARHQMPHPHEYFCPMEALTAHAGHENPAMRSLLARASAASAFMDPPHGAD